MLQEHEGPGRYLLGTSGLEMGVLEVEPVTLHRKPFMYTVVQMSDGYTQHLRIYSLCAEPLSTEWIQCQAQIQPPSGQGGMSAGIWNCVLTVQTHWWLTLKMAKSSGWMLFTSEVYAMERAQPFTSLMPYEEMN